MQGPYLCDLRHTLLTWANTGSLRILQDSQMGPQELPQQPDWCKFVGG